MAPKESNFLWRNADFLCMPIEERRNCRVNKSFEFVAYKVAGEGEGVRVLRPISESEWGTGEGGLEQSLKTESHVLLPLSSELSTGFA